MSAEDNGGPAFPIDRLTAHGIAIHEVDPANEQAYIKRVAELSHGMTKRDEFAKEAMHGAIAGHISHYGHENHWPVKDIASYAYELADAMLEARK